MKTFGYIMLFLMGITGLSIILKTCGTATRMNDNLQNTVYEQYKPEELLRKYEWFKDASSQLDQKFSTLKVYESRFTNTKNSYGPDSLNRHKWTRTDLEQWNVWQSEYLGVKASYNELAAEYNSSMSKFNYRFCNVGQLPAGQSSILPREYREYLEK